MEAKFNVAVFDINKKSLAYFDVLPYLRNKLQERKKRFRNYRRTKAYKEGNITNEYCIMPQTYEELKQTILKESMYQFWARCEYEILISDWPCQEKTFKVDVYQQIQMNIDIITEILAREFLKKKNQKPIE